MKHELPPLPYGYNALEPHYDEATVRLHHDAHHKAYVDGLNNAGARLAEARDKGDFALVKHWEREIAFHGSGHLLHTLFWQNMVPGGGGQATGAVAEQLNKDFGSFDNFKKQFSAAAVAVEGSGWAVLCWNPSFHSLVILTAEKHQNLTQWGVVPLLTVDVWEHAYYLKYQNKRAAWVEAWWNLVNWDDVNKRFEAAG
ncbi:superoxide dismutase [Desulfocucumis palustris]|uniref:Superoxide dismutase n=1 Tax=Desulfocucumis palustris TaxID=1898651 RepID=A0A2L2XB73_9FIRM|nr:superoxide dismutase [Desulfocucumis palustris]GBF32923.1 superoxide dismutase [Desulfocucumis palustris]